MEENEKKQTSDPSERYTEQDYYRSSEPVNQGSTEPKIQEGYQQTQDPQYRYQQTQAQNPQYRYQQGQNQQAKDQTQGVWASQQNYNWNQNYQNGQFTGQSYSGGPTGQPPVQRPHKKITFKNNFGLKLLRCAAFAAVFGLVAGGAFQGVNYISDRTSGRSLTQEVQSTETGTEEESALTTTDSEEKTVTKDVSQVVDNVMPSIVAITNMSQTEVQDWFGQSQTYQSESAGSGIIVSQDADNLYIATNNHVVSGSTSLTVCFQDNNTASGEIKGTDPGSDLAVVAVAKTDIKDETLDSIRVATLGNSDNLVVGESAIAIGNALGYGQSVTTGVISALDREVSVQDESTGTAVTNDLIQTDAAINPGNSGGALINTRGEVIGINSVKYSDTAVEGIGYAIPMESAKPIIEDLITREVVDSRKSAYLGISGVDVTESAAGTYGMPEGIYVADVVKGSAADEAGIVKGDVITKFAGHKVAAMADLLDLLQYYEAGKEVEVVAEVSNNGTYEEQTFTVTLGSKN